MNIFYGFAFSCFMNRILSMPMFIGEVLVLAIELIMRIKVRKRFIGALAYLTLLMLSVQVGLYIAQTYTTERIETFGDDYVYFGQIVNGTANGKGRLYDKNGQMIFKGQYINNMKNGEGMEYVFDEELNQSILEYEGDYVDDYRDGYGVVYWVNGDYKGQVMYEGELYKGEMCGKGILYEGAERKYEGGFAHNQRYGFGVDSYVGDEGEKMVVTGTYTNNMKNGYFEEYKDGELIFQGNYANDVRDGEEGKEYYENGNVKYEGDYKNGFFHGNGTAYYEDGSIEYVGSFENGQFHGSGTIYYENGEIQYKGEWSNGSADGEGEHYDEDGKLKYRGSYKNGRRDG